VTATSRRLALALGSVIVLAAALRFPHLGYGLPGTTYVDGFRFVDEARAMATSTDGFQPSDFMYPGLLKVLLAFVYGTFGIESKTWLYLTPRVLSALFDLGTVALVFGMARRVSNLYGATLGAALHATSIILVTSSRVETADTTMTFFMTAALFLLTGPKIRPVHFIVAGVAVGCATGAKYSGVYAGLALLFGAILAWKQGAKAPRAAGLAALGGALAAAAFLATTPWFIPLFAIYRKALAVLAEAQTYGQIGHVQTSRLDYLISSTPTCEQPWLASSLLYNVGPLALGAGLAGILLALAGRLRPPARLYALYAVAYYGIITGTGHIKEIRFLLPALPAFAALGGAAVAELFEKRPALRRAPLQAALAIALLAYPALGTGRYLAASSRPMTNDLAFAWAADHLPAGSTVLLSPFYLESLRRLDLKILTLAGAAQNQYRLGSTLGIDTEVKPLFRPELIASARASGIQYVVLNSYFENALGDTAENRRFFPRSVEAYAAFRDRLAKEGELLYEVDGDREGRLGPDVRVYRLKPAE
jgi:4-amino-4-deoxy-L-arabinose transferase-like glycosyltransferase